MSTAKRVLPWMLGAVALVLVLRHALASGPQLWVPYSDAALARASAEHRPVMLDFWAEWCHVCRDMDEVMARPEIADAAGDLVVLRVDMTAPGPAAATLGRRYGVEVLPTAIFLDRAGQERSGLRLDGSEPTDRLVARLRRAAAPME